MSVKNPFRPRRLSGISDSTMFPFLLYVAVFVLTFRTYYDPGRGSWFRGPDEEDNVSSYHYGDEDNLVDFPPQPLVYGRRAGGAAANPPNDSGSAAGVGSSSPSPDRSSQQRADGNEDVEHFNHTTVRGSSLSTSPRPAASSPRPRFQERRALSLVERVLTACDGRNTPHIEGRRRADTVNQQRAIGSWTNDECAAEVFVKELRSLGGEVEKMQSGPGSYHIDFIGGMVNSYDRLTNVVARLPGGVGFPGTNTEEDSGSTTPAQERGAGARRGRAADSSSLPEASLGVLGNLFRGCEPPYAILVNSHFDSAVGSPGAADALSTSAMAVEIARNFRALLTGAYGVREFYPILSYVPHHRRTQCCVQKPRPSFVQIKFTPIPICALRIPRPPQLPPTDETRTTEGFSSGV